MVQARFDTGFSAPGPADVAGKLDAVAGVIGDIKTALTRQAVAGLDQVGGLTRAALQPAESGVRLPLAQAGQLLGGVSEDIRTYIMGLLSDVHCCLGGEAPPGLAPPETPPGGFAPPPPAGDGGPPSGFPCIVIQREPTTGHWDYYRKILVPAFRDPATGKVTCPDYASAQVKDDTGQCPLFCYDPGTVCQGWEVAQVDLYSLNPDLRQACDPATGRGVLLPGGLRPPTQPPLPPIRIPPPFGEAPPARLYPPAGPPPPPLQSPPPRGEPPPGLGGGGRGEVPPARPPGQIPPVGRGQCVIPDCEPGITLPHPYGADNPTWDIYLSPSTCKFCVVPHGSGLTADGWLFWCGPSMYYDIPPDGGPTEGMWLAMQVLANAGYQVSCPGLPPPPAGQPPPTQEPPPAKLPPPPPAACPPAPPCPPEGKRQKHYTMDEDLLTNRDPEDIDRWISYYGEEYRDYFAAQTMTDLVSATFGILGAPPDDEFGPVT